MFLELSDGAPGLHHSQVLHLLEWLEKISDQSMETPIEELRQMIVSCAAKCLWAELERLRGKKPGEWRVNELKSSFSLVHSKHPSKILYLELLPDCSVVIQTRARGRQLFEKILVPFGAHPDQVLNLLQLAAHDVYASRHFDQPELYKDDVRRRRSTRIAEELEAIPLFKLVHRYRHELKVCFRMNKAAQRELVSQYISDGTVSDEPVAVEW